MGMWPRVGVVGVGAIAEALVVGLCAAGDRDPEIVLSPRNAEIAARLAARFANVSVARDNQGVVDASDLVVLAVRPQVTEEVLRALRFRAGQEILSLIATFNVERLTPLVAPAKEISRAIPLPPVAERQGPLTVFTRSDEVLRLLDGLGRVIRVEDESHLELISATTSLMGSYFGMLGAVDSWLVGRGFAPEASRAFVGELFLNLATATGRHADDSFSTLSRDFSTPGGLNEQAWRELRAAGWGDQIQAALDLVLARIGGRATLETRLGEERSSA